MATPTPALASASCPAPPSPRNRSVTSTGPPMRGKRSRLAPLPIQIAIDQVGPVPHDPAGARAQLFEKGQLAGPAEREKGAARHLSLRAGLGDGVAAVRAHATARDPERIT